MGLDTSIIAAHILPPALQHTRTVTLSHHLSLSLSLSFISSLSSFLFALQRGGALLPLCRLVGSYKRYYFERVSVCARSKERGEREAEERQKSGVLARSSSSSFFSCTLSAVHQEDEGARGDSDLRLMPNCVAESR